MSPFLCSVLASREADRQKLLATARSLEALPDPAEPEPLSSLKPAKRTRAQRIEEQRALKMSQCLSVLQLQREGVGIEEIATRLGRTSRTVRRLLARAKAHPLSTQEAA